MLKTPYYFLHVLKICLTCFFLDTPPPRFPVPFDPENVIGEGTNILCNFQRCDRNNQISKFITYCEVRFGYLNRFVRRYSYLEKSNTCDFKLYKFIKTLFLA